MTTYKDTTGLTAWLVRCLKTDIVLTAIVTLLMLFPARAQTFLWAHVLGIAAASNVIIVSLTAVLFLRWIYFANKNARSLGATGMTFTPGWAIGYYFIPIINLYKPRRAMIEIWQASANPVDLDWKNRDYDKMIDLWWALWIINLFLNRAVGKTDAVGALDVLNMMAHITLGIVAIIMVTRLAELQTHSAATSRPDANTDPAMGQLATA